MRRDYDNDPFALRELARELRSFAEDYRIWGQKDMQAHCLKRAAACEAKAHELEQAPGIADTIMSLTSVCAMIVVLAAYYWVLP